VLRVYETSEEILLAINMVEWGIRQTARQDAHKLRGDYPRETDKKPTENLLDELVAAINGKPGDGVK
jgi:hypothetical protein